MELDLGFDLRIKNQFTLTNVNAPIQTGMSRNSGLKAIEFITSWFEEHADIEWPLIVQVDKIDKNSPYTVEVYGLNEAQSLNEQLAEEGWGDY
jgi:hypothetical protein